MFVADLSEDGDSSDSETETVESSRSFVDNSPSQILSGSGSLLKGN